MNPLSPRSGTGSVGRNDSAMGTSSRASNKSALQKFSESNGKMNVYMGNATETQEARFLRQRKESCHKAYYGGASTARAAIREY